LFLAVAVTNVYLDVLDAGHIIGSTLIQQRRPMSGSLRKLAVGAASLAVLGCSDSSLGPSHSTARSFTLNAAPSLDLNPSTTFSGFKSTTITLTSAGGTFSIGNGLFTIKIPANAVCDPTVSSYGEGTWDSPCTTLAAGQALTATVTYGYTSSNVPVLDVAPGIRFSPTSVVTLGTTAYASSITANSSYYASNPQALHYFGMYYTPDLGSTGYTDAGKDNSLVTHVNLSTGFVWRRVKHFSGYNIVTGLPCDPSPDDPNCVDDGGPDVQK
jgi:hypothetical protein